MTTTTTTTTTTTAKNNSTSTRAPAPIPTPATSSVTVTATATATATAPGSFCFAIGGVPSYIYIVSSYCTLSTLPHCPNSQRHSLARLAVLPTATMTHLHVQTRSTQPVLFSAQSATDFKLVMYSIKVRSCFTTFPLHQSRTTMTIMTTTKTMTITKNLEAT
ncbi:hypothetical protein HZH68_000166 [Vespula germanica]|uniref:Uncharacterized protein n=1 Tax=Vespula germanica TaxID=30212 RepID=A0A834U5R7_VESGE|nr:hypothetical protein HZH68_000166 [Vespula germanica]